MTKKEVGTWFKTLIHIAEEAAGHQQDHRFSPWVKFVDRVSDKADGYAFEGAFVQEGTTEMVIKPRVFLAMTSSGSSKYQTKHYNIIVMDAEGNLTATDIHTTSKTKGWALRIRSQVADLVEQLAGEPVSPQALTLDEIFDRLMQVRERIDSDAPLTEADNALLYDMALALGLSQLQAEKLAGDIPPDATRPMPTYEERVVTITFDQLARKVSEEFSVGQVVIGNFLPYVGKVASVDDDAKTATFIPASLEETAARLKEVAGLNPGDEGFEETIEIQRRFV